MNCSLTSPNCSPVVFVANVAIQYVEAYFGKTCTIFRDFLYLNHCGYGLTISKYFGYKRKTKCTAINTSKR